jgi:hypothetical protein
MIETELLWPCLNADSGLNEGGVFSC